MFHRRTARLRELSLSVVPYLPNPIVASIAYIGGYVARVVAEKVPCENCIAIIQKPNGNSAAEGLISYQDRGGLLYPTQELVRVLMALKRYAELLLQDRKKIQKPLSTAVRNAVEVLIDLPVLVCENTDISHRRVLLELVCEKFMRPLMANYALDITDRNAVAKMYSHKPLSRKFVKL